MFPVLIQAQTGVETEEVDVVVGYTPVLADAVKINISAAMPENNSKPDTLEYQVDPHLFKVSNAKLPIKPIALPKETDEPLDNVYAKAGFGTQMTPLLEAYINSNRSEKYNLGVFGQYISSNGSLENQDYSHLNTGASGKLFFDKKVTVPAELFYTNDVVHYYGYNDDDTSFDALDTKQKFDYYGFNIGIENIEENAIKVDYKIRGGFSKINDIHKYNEINPYIYGWVETQLDNGHEAGGSLFIDNYQYDGPIDYKNTIIAFKPHYNIINDNWSIKAAFEFNVDDGGEFAPLPDAEFSYDLIGDKLVFIVGVNAFLQRNSFKNLTDANPFLGDTIDFNNSIVNELYAGIRGSTYGNFSFSVKGYQKIISDMPFYLNQEEDTRKFDVVYSDAKLTGANLELSYFTAGKLRILGAVDGFVFSELNEFDKPYHTPTLNWTLSSGYYFNKKFNMNLDVFSANKTYALLPGDVTEEIEGHIDFNLGATYKYSKYFNIFLNLNNLTGSKYRQFYNYPVYGFQAIGGLSFSF